MKGYLIKQKNILTLRQFLPAESPLNKKKNAFYFMLFIFIKSLFILKIFKFLCWYFGHVAKRLD